MSTSTESLRDNTTTFVNRHNVRMSCDWAATNPNIDERDWAQGTLHYRCVLRMDRKRLTTYFSQGPAISGEPTTADVLNCLASDACGLENARDFDDWCSDYGYASDSRQAAKIFKVIGNQAKQLRQFAGDRYD